MKKCKLIIAIILLFISNISVILTVVIPKFKMDIGTWLFHTFSWEYHGYYSVIVLAISLIIYFFFFEEKENHIINRLKLSLSFMFLLSLISNITFN